MIKLIYYILVFSLLIDILYSTDMNYPVKIAVEFTSHGASGFIAKKKGWFKEAGLNVVTYNGYATGMATAMAMVRGDVNVAYICLIPAINIYSNGKIPIKIVCGTHKGGYGLVVNPSKIKTVYDLQKSNILIGCMRAGSPVEALMHKLVTKYNLNKDKVFKNIRYMPANKMLIALKNNNIDGIFCPEQYPTMAENLGFKLLLKADDLWENMQGSVLIVTEELAKNHPGIVKKLKEITIKSINFIHNHPQEASKIVSEKLNISVNSVFPVKMRNGLKNLTVTKDIIYTSLLKRMVCTAEINSFDVQKAIDYVAKIGNIDKSFSAEKLIFKIKK